MKKPLHRSKENEGHENRAILSALALLRPYERLLMIQHLDLTDEEKGSVLWTLWERDKKRSRPHVYSSQKSLSKVLVSMMEKTKANIQVILKILK